MSNTESPSRKRQCMPCSACCDGWVQMTVEGHEIYPGKPCPFSAGDSCTIYDRRPDDPCRRFICGWRAEGSTFPDWMRPDLSKAMVLPAMQIWKGATVDVAVPVGRRIPGRALNWLKQAAKQSGRPLIYTEQIVKDGRFTSEQEIVGFGPSAFQEDVARLAAQGGRFW